MLSLERFAEIRAAIEASRSREQVLDEQGLLPSQWVIAERRWLAALSADAAAGRTALAARYLAAYRTAAKGASTGAAGAQPPQQRHAPPPPPPVAAPSVEPAARQNQLFVPSYLLSRPAPVPAQPSPPSPAPPPPAPAPASPAPPSPAPAPPPAIAANPGQPMKVVLKGTLSASHLSIPVARLPFQKKPNKALSGRVMMGTADSTPAAPPPTAGQKNPALAGTIAPSPDPSPRATLPFATGREPAKPLQQAAPSTPSTPSIRINRQLSGTLDVPDAEALPLPPPVADIPNLSVEQYAWVTASLRKAEGPSLHEAMARFRLTTESRKKLDAVWRAHMARHPAVQLAFDQALARHLASSR